MSVRRSLAAMILCASITACGSREAPPSDLPPVKDSNDLAAIRAMEKARAVEDTTMQHKEDIDRAIDAAESNADR